MNKVAPSEEVFLGGEEQGSLFDKLSNDEAAN
jgi:hypothetical protein